LISVLFFNQLRSDEAKPDAKPQDAKPQDAKHRERSSEEAKPDAKPQEHSSEEAKPDAKHQQRSSEEHSVEDAKPESLLDLFVKQFAQTNDEMANIILQMCEFKAEHEKFRRIEDEIKSLIQCCLGEVLSPRLRSLLEIASF
jgi:hypothetical protein